MYAVGRYDPEYALAEDDSPIGFLGIRPGAPWVQLQHLAYDEHDQLTECAPPPEDITIEFGPQN